MRAETNWAGNYRYRAARIHRPRSLDEVRGTVARTRFIVARPRTTRRHRRPRFTG